MCGFRADHETYDDVVPCGGRSVTFANYDDAYIQVKMFFSSGAAHTNGGGSRCIATYSLFNCSHAAQSECRSFCTSHAAHAPSYELLSKPFPTMDSAEGKEIVDDGGGISGEGASTAEMQDQVGAHVGLAWQKLGLRLGRRAAAPCRHSRT